MDSIAACGDVNRNVMCRVEPEAGPVEAQALAWARRLSEHLLPATRAWREIWIDGEKIDTDQPPEEEPIYGRTYLPRKFKAAIAVPPVNDVDIYSQDLGFIAIAEGDRLVGFNVSVGGGLGCSHGEPETFPRLADVIGFIQPRDLLAVAEAVVTIQRDLRRARPTASARASSTPSRSTGWTGSARAGMAFACAAGAGPPGALRAQRGSLRLDRAARRALAAWPVRGKRPPAAGPPRRLREVIARHVADVRLTPNQNLVLAGIEPADRDAVSVLLASAGLGERQVSAIRQRSMACVALPTCVLAMAEAERYLPDLVTAIEELAAKHGIEQTPITVRMSGCPNGCSRPYLAEIGFVGRAPGRYNMYLGAAFDGSRLSRLYLDNADEATILDAVDSLFAALFAVKREDNEHFGDFLIRSGVVEAVRHGSEVNQESAS
jgi:sulfite reductase (NADPH) hemoprotein beta-component